MLRLLLFFFFFFFNDTATTEIYTLSLHDALPICVRPRAEHGRPVQDSRRRRERRARAGEARSQLGQHRRSAVRTDRKSTRLNSSHGYISYAVFCLKKKKNTNTSRLHSPTRAITPH